MSFILQFFNASTARTVDDAQRVLDGLTGADPDFARRWRGFVELIAESFPDLSHDETREARNLWPEGLPPMAGDDAFVNVMINLDLLDVGVMSHVARIADAVGLQILDPQNGLLYGPGLRQIGLNDAAPQPLPEVTPFARRLMTPNIRGMELEAAQVRVAEALRAGLGPGFETVAAESATVLRRPHGTLTQMVSVGVMRSSDRINARTYVRIGFASDALKAAWLPLVGPDFEARLARYDRAEGGVAMQLCWYVPSASTGELPGGLSLHSLASERFGNPAELARVADAAQTWSACVLRPFLEGLQHVGDLAPLAISEAALEHCGTRRHGVPDLPDDARAGQPSGTVTAAALRGGLPGQPGPAAPVRLVQGPEARHFDALVKGLARTSTA